MTRFEDHRMSFESSDDDYRGFDLNADDETARGPLILTLALGVLVVFGAVVWNTYRQGIREPGDVPLIRAESGPMKVPGERSAGGDASGVDATFYDQFESAPPATLRGPMNERRNIAGNASLDTLQGGPAIDLTEGMGSDLAASEGLPRADQLRELAELDIDDTALDVGAGSSAGAAARSIDAETLRRETPVQVIATPRAAPALTQTQTQTSAPHSPPAPTPRAEAEKPDQTASTPQPATGQTPVFDPDGQFLVQMAAYRTEAAATNGWTEALRRYPDLLAGAERRVQRADLAARGVFYRLQIGAFGTRDDAMAFCQRLKAEGGDCIVVGARA